MNGHIMTTNPHLKRVGQDFIDLRRALDSVPAFKDAWIVGPDTHGIQQNPVPHWEPVLTAFVKIAKQISAHAATVHHYYFSAPGSHDSKYRDVKTFNRWVCHVYVQCLKTFINICSELIYVAITEALYCKYCYVVHVL